MEVELKFTTPQTEEELFNVVEDFKFLKHFYPVAYSEEDFITTLKCTLGSNTLVHANNILIGCFLLDIHRKSVELHGVVRPDMSVVVPYYQPLLKSVYEIIFQEIFIAMDKEKIIIKAMPDNKGVRGFAIQNGFERLNNIDKGRRIWKLTRDKYKDRLNEA